MIEFLLASLAAIVASFFAGKMKGMASERSKMDAEYRETRKRMDDAEYEVVDGFGSDPDAARRWLRERGKSGGDL